MLFSWILNSRINTVIFVLFTMLQITSCTTEEVQEILSNIEDNTQNVGATSLTSETTSNSGNSPTNNISGNTDSSNSNNGSSNDSSSNNNPVDQVGSNVTTAMYSYNSDLSDPRPLSGATLNRTTVYLFFTNTANYSNMTFYCCKGLTGDSKGEPHNAAVTDSTETFVHEIDLSQYTTAGTRELYVDARRVDGNAGDRPDSYSATFSIDTAGQSTSGQTTSTAAPTPTAPPVLSDVNLSWVAPFEREDNNPISPAEIAGYKIYYGTSRGNYTNSIDINDGSIDNYTVENLVAGTYYFVITTRDTDGRESAYSPVVTKNI